MLGIVVVCLLFAAIAMATTQASAQQRKSEKTAATAKKDVPKTEKQAAVLPFRSTLGALDKIAKTITVGERTFQVTSETKLSKGGKPATFDNATVGAEVSGSYLKGDDGKLNVKTARFGPKLGAEAKKTDNPKK